MKNNQKKVYDRQSSILRLVQERGDVKVEELAEEFNISLMTVRRDLKYLEEKQLLFRSHGGAVSREKARETCSQEELIVLCRDRISEYAARFIEDGDRLFINGSRTALNMLEYVKDKQISVVTNNCAGIGKTYDPKIALCFTGGEIRSNVMIGEYVMRNLLGLSADKTFLGCAAVYEDGEFRYDIPTEIGINEAMISRTSKALYVLADHSKLQNRGIRESYYGSCSYDCPCTLVTDDNADLSIVEKLRQKGVNVILVPTK